MNPEIRSQKSGVRKLGALVLLTAVLCSLTSACYSPRESPLQPGEKIIFRDATRANEYRGLSGNDAARAGSVVEITRPTRITNE